MVAPLSPQKVQWCLAPHQQPRADSKGIVTCLVGSSNRAARSKYSV